MKAILSDIYGRPIEGDNTLIVEKAPFYPVNSDDNGKIKHRLIPPENENYRTILRIRNSKIDTVIWHINSSETKELVYNPIIERGATLVFSKGYFKSKSEKKPIGIFKNPYAIQQG